MSSVSGVTSSSGLSGYGGLASGLDRDTLIEDMTYATRAKIAAQEQKKQTQQWMQQAMQGLTSSMYDFSEKYMSFTSTSNLLSSTLFAQSLITTTGANSSYVSVSGLSSSANEMIIAGVKSLAQDEKMTTNNAVSDQVLSTGAFNTKFDDLIETSKIDGDSITFKYGEDTYSVKVESGEVYDGTPESLTRIVASINEAMKAVAVPGGEDANTLDEVVKFEVVDGKVKLSALTGNATELVSGTGDVLKELGFSGESVNLMEEASKSITGGAVDLVAKEAGSNYMEGETLSFNYNGKTATVKFGAYESKEAMQSDLQKQLDEAFGTGRVEVSWSGEHGSGNLDSLEFRTVKPSGSASVADTTSHLYLAGGSSKLIGESGYLNVKAGESNRVNLNASIAESGLASGSLAPTSGEMIIKNGSGDEIDLTTHGLTWESSVDDIIETINGIEELNIEVSYQKETDKFFVKSTQEGASGNIELSGNVADILFGSDVTKIEGKDAVIAVQYEGMDEAIEITRSSNSFDMDGLNVTVSGTFGYTGDVLDTTQAVKFEAKTDTDKATGTVKEMIDAYNEILANVNTELTTTHDRDYAPLTDEQKEEMTESEIENWEKEAKKGMLYNDSDLRMLSDELRFLIPSSMRDAFEEMGITVSSDYKDKGKLVFDEAKFKAALEEDPEAVQDAFTAKSIENEDGTTTAAGLMVNLETIMDKYAGMTGSEKGILVEKAGSIHAPTTVVENSYQNEIKSIEEFIAELEDKLEMEQDRYIREFTSLETLISQMNSQSSYISSMFTY